jgi:Cu-Zn family superoxide dismutase
MKPQAVAVFQENQVKGEVLVSGIHSNSVKINAIFTKLPPGKHGFHIHKAGDLRGKGCLGACDHWHVGPPTHHGGPPGSAKKVDERHTGDLGNVEIGPDKKPWKGEFIISGVTVEDFWGRSAIIHADEDDLGLGDFPDSLTTGHSGKRIGCAIFGRIGES